MTRTLEKLVGGLLDGLARIRCPGEEIDHLSHGLQTARLAMAASADEELVAAAVLHDVGRIPAVTRRHPGVSHEVAGSRWCRHRLPNRTAWLVGVHDRCRWIVHPVPPAWKHGDGRAVSPDALKRLLGHRWAGDALALRRWDEEARRPGGVEADRDEVQRLLMSLWNH